MQYMRLYITFISVLLHQLDFALSQFEKSSLNFYGDPFVGVPCGGPYGNGLPFNNIQQPVTSSPSLTYTAATGANWNPCAQPYNPYPAPTVINLDDYKNNNNNNDSGNNFPDLLALLIGNKDGTTYVPYPIPIPVPCMCGEDSPWMDMFQNGMFGGSDYFNSRSSKRGRLKRRGKSSYSNGRNTGCSCSNSRSNQRKKCSRKKKQNKPKSKPTNSSNNEDCENVNEFDGEQSNNSTLSSSNKANDGCSNASPDLDYDYDTDDEEISNSKCGNKNKYQAVINVKKY